jgi:RHS repeat-associated protein
MLDMAYSNNGNITTKSDIGTSFGYNNSSKPFAITNISTSSGIIPLTPQIITYNSFEKINSITEGQFNANFVYNEDDERCKMETLQNGTSFLTRWYFGGNYIKELNGSTVKEYSFIGGDAYTAPIVAMTQDGTTSWYYLLHDNLGSITHVVDASNNAVLAEYSFDAWGRRRNPVNWSYDLAGQPDLFAGRGFTGHETMTEFGLINMNGRLYDPAVGRFLSPDPSVQMPDFTQNLNRYAYVLNNPLKYTDPSGDFFILDSWIMGLISGGWKEANKRAVNDIKISLGLLVFDTNKTFLGQIWEVASRLTWQLPQTIGGFSTAQTYNLFGLKGGVESVEYKYGATVVTTRDDWTAVTQGSYIVGGNSLKADANNSVFQHEYGHYLQSQSMGWAYYPRVGIPSVRSEHGNYTKNYPKHAFHPVEQDADRRAFLYFNKHVDGFQNDTFLGDNKGWNFDENPLDVNKSGHGSYIDYQNPNHLQLLNSLKVSAKWYDYAGWLLFGVNGAVGAGLINTDNYNN